jgi:hypothetical protein
VDRDFNFIRYFLLDGNTVGFRERLWQLLGNDDGPDVLLVVFVLFTAILRQSSNHQQHDERLWNNLMAHWI